MRAATRPIRGHNSIKVSALAGARDDDEGAFVRVVQRDGEALGAGRKFCARGHFSEQLLIAVERERELDVVIGDAVEST